MTTQDNESPEGIGHDLLQRLLIDPVVSNILQEVLATNKLDRGMTFAEAHQLATEYNQRLREIDLIHETGRLTGSALYPIGSEDDQELVHQYVDGISVQLEGFTTLRIEEGTAQSQYAEDLYEVVLLFHELFNNEGEAKSCAVAIKINDLAALELDTAMSPEHAKDLLEYYLPYLKSRLDDLIECSEDEVHFLALLSEFIWDNSDQDDSLRLIRAINVYLGSEVHFDQLPYVLGDLAADIIVQNDDRTLQVSELEIIDEASINIEAIVMMTPPSEEQDTDHIIIPYLRGQLYGSERFSPPTLVMIPLVAIQKLHSLRE